MSIFFVSHNDFFVSGDDFLISCDDFLVFHNNFLVLYLIDKVYHTYKKPPLRWSSCLAILLYRLNVNSGTRVYSLFLSALLVYV